jgi:hypothetical protein
MKKQINEIKRMQQLAGILKENDKNKELLEEGNFDSAMSILRNNGVDLNKVMFVRPSGGYGSELIPGKDDAKIKQYLDKGGELLLTTRKETDGSLLTAIKNKIAIKNLRNHKVLVADHEIAIKSTYLVSGGMETATQGGVDPDLYRQEDENFKNKLNSINKKISSL